VEWLTRRTGAADLKFNYIFIVAYARSGSTLLQGIINSIDGVVIRGGPLTPSGDLRPTQTP
jgi:hypothetical protein